MANIFVEGVADKKFIEDYLIFLFPEGLIKEVEIKMTKGWTNLNTNSLLNEMDRAEDDGEKNVVIFDADTDCEARRVELLKIKEENGLDFDVFLFPNNKDTGDLESLLEEIINPKNTPIFQTWEGYETNLSKIMIEGRRTPLTTPARKTKIYAYLEALLPSSKSQKEKIKEKKRDYRKAEHWDLTVDYLKPLKTFLETFLKDEEN